MLAADPRRPAVVLVRPQEDGNLGAVARAMANMGLERLILVAPRADPEAVAARAMAVSARPILKQAVVTTSLNEALAPFARVVGTTSQRERTLAQSPLSARELPRALAADPPDLPTALVFGPEASGLTQEELARCAPLVRIDSAPGMSTLNLAQAVLVVAYELRLAGTWGGDGPSGPPPDPENSPATQAELQGLFAQAEPLLGAIGFERDTTYGGVVRELRALAVRARPTAREVRILRGIVRRAGHALERGGNRSSSDRLPSHQSGPSGPADPHEES